MKRILINALFVLSVSMLGTANAQAKSVETTPSNLLNLARNGYFQEQGIPGFSAFENALKSRQLTAEDIIQAAVQQDRLSADHLNDTVYVQSVNRLLNGFTGD
jgi:hypothetical protein